ncbi:hypothetical protein AB0A73_21795 [Glycomyces sp. NPDC047369]
MNLTPLIETIAGTAFDAFAFIVTDPWTALAAAGIGGACAIRRPLLAASSAVAIAVLAWCAHWPEAAAVATALALAWLCDCWVRPKSACWRCRGDGGAKARFWFRTTASTCGRCGGDPWRPRFGTRLLCRIFSERFAQRRRWT